MSRRVLVFLVLGVVLVVGVGTALVVSGRSALSDDRDAVDARWATLRPAAVTRYQALGQLSQALGAVGAGDRTYSKDLAAALEEWRRLVDRPTPDPGPEAETANRLEGLANRVRVTMAASARLSRDPAITGAFEAFDVALLPPPEVRAYNRAVRKYQDTRSGVRERLAASVLGYGPRAVLVIGRPSA